MSLTKTLGANGWTVDPIDLPPAHLSTDANGNTVLMGPEGAIPINPTLRTVGYENEQPVAIINPVTNFGKVVANFTTGKWTINSGTPTLTQGHTGWDGSGNKTGITSRTGQPGMLKVVPDANAVAEIRIVTPATNLLNAATSGKLGLWVYLESQPGYQPNGSVTGTLGMTISTNAGSNANALYVGFNANQIREGWNFLKVVQRDPSAYTSGSGVTEYHPFGVSCTGYGTGADSNILENDIANIKIDFANLLGATLYFDSIWTDFDATPQMVLGNDGGVGLVEYGLPVFQQYGWRGYFAFPFNTVDSGLATLTYQSNLDKDTTSFSTLYQAGWDAINHTTTHGSLGKSTDETVISYQIEFAKAWLTELGFVRGSEFYASPQSSTSRLAAKVLTVAGIKLQRHALKTNVSVTQFGIDNPQHVGGIDMGSVSAGGLSKVTAGVSGSVSGWQTATKIKRFIDVIVAYGDTGFPFWHGITTTGDNGAGEDLTGDNLLITKSAFELSMAYLREREIAGAIRVTAGISGFWYGV